jgi:Neutral/alkaline non-lysosomal ceramidase, N-terminal
LLARAASCDVTPRDRPMRLAGYAARTEPVSTILDPIEISAVLLECGGRRVLIFSFDLMIVGAELQEMILAKLAKHGFNSGEVVLLATHTHFAPATDQACVRLGIPEAQFVSDMAVAAEGLLLQMLREPASEVTLEIRQGRLNHSINRRRRWRFPTFGRTYGLRFKSVVMAPNPQGPTDERATVLLLRRVDDAKVIGAIWHYTCHPTAVIPDNVISSDFPGAVRRALRERFGAIPCVFAQGFCGDIRPKMRRGTQSASLRDRLRRMVRTMMSGPSFASPAAGEWTRWSNDLAAKVVAIAQAPSADIFSPATLATGSASVPLGGFFTGSAPDKPLAVQVIRLGDAVELVALSAEATVEWRDIIDREIPVQSGRIRLYAGYLGALFGYLPTAVQIAEGGYEIEGFQPLFGLSGKFESEKITSCVIGGVKQAFDEIERAAGNNG